MTFDPDGQYPAKEPNFGTLSWLKFFKDLAPELWKLGRDIARVGGMEMKKIRAMDTGVKAAKMAATALENRNSAVDEQPPQPDINLSKPVKRCGNCAKQQPTTFNKTGMRCLQHGLDVDASKEGCRQWSVKA